MPAMHGEFLYFLFFQQIFRCVFITMVTQKCILRLLKYYEKLDKILSRVSFKKLICVCQLHMIMNAFRQNTSRNNNVVITPIRRQFDVIKTTMTSFSYDNDVIIA